MTKVILEVSGGVVQRVLSDSADVEVVKIEWDENESSGYDVNVGTMLIDPLHSMSVDSASVLASQTP